MTDKSLVKEVLNLASTGDVCAPCPDEVGDNCDEDGDGRDPVDEEPVECEDTDEDGVCDTVDNCPNEYNADQKDKDGTGRSMSATHAQKTLMIGVWKMEMAVRCCV